MGRWPPRALPSLVAAFFKGALQGNAATALVIFLVAALGGFFLFFKNLNSKPLPTPVVLLHAVLAVTAFVLLAVTVL